MTQNSKIAAIKHLREMQSLGLQEAKEVIDTWGPGTTRQVNAAVSALHPDEALSPAALAEIAALVEDGQKIRAIKRYREETGTDLKQAKDAIDNWMQ